MFLKASRAEGARRDERRGRSQLPRPLWAGPRFRAVTYEQQEATTESSPGLGGQTGEDYFHQLDLGPKWE